MTSIEKGIKKNSTGFSLKCASLCGRPFSYQQNFCYRSAFTRTQLIHGRLKIKLVIGVYFRHQLPSNYQPEQRCIYQFLIDKNLADVILILFLIHCPICNSYLLISKASKQLYQNAFRDYQFIVEFIHSFKNILY